MILVMDTNAYSALLSGDEAVRTILEEAEDIVVPAIVAGELMAGFMLGDRYAKNSAALEAFLRQSGIRLAEVDLAVARNYGALIMALRRAGTPIPSNDVWIGATALSTNGSVLTRDAHFDLVPGVARIGW
jgi:tRNA(fMet)-specific endonuclease VapC